MRCFLASKLHGAVITQANLQYHGSLSIDTQLMEAVGIQAFEQVNVYNLTNGERFTTYAIQGKSGEICLNGAAAHKGEIGQEIIIATYVWLDEKAIQKHVPLVAILDRKNKIKEILEKRP